MISEKKFANDYNSFWNALTPTMSQFVLRMNKNAISFKKPIKVITSQENRGFLNETAFNVSAQRNLALINGLDFKVDEDTFQTSKQQAWSKVSQGSIDAEPSLGPLSILEVKELYESLETFLEKYRKSRSEICFKPVFKGCGFLDPCEGDFTIDNILFEVKAGNRNFRGQDLRQLLIYMALNTYTNGFLYSSLGLVNPRLGKFVVYDVDEISYLLSGKTGLDLVNEIVIFLLGYGISK